MASSGVQFEINQPFTKVITDQLESDEKLTTETMSNLELSIDIEKFERVFSNLFSNSIKYSMEEPYYSNLILK